MRKKEVLSPRSKTIASNLPNLELLELPSQLTEQQSSHYIEMLEKFYYVLLERMTNSSELSLAQTVQSEISKEKLICDKKHYIKAYDFYRRLEKISNEFFAEPSEELAKTIRTQLMLFQNILLKLLQHLPQKFKDDLNQNKKIDIDSIASKIIESSEIMQIEALHKPEQARIYTPTKYPAGTQRRKHGLWGAKLKLEQGYQQCEQVDPLNMPESQEAPQPKLVKKKLSFSSFLEQEDSNQSSPEGSDKDCEENKTELPILKKRKKGDSAEQQPLELMELNVETATKQPKESAVSQSSFFVPFPIGKAQKKKSGKTLFPKVPVQDSGYPFSLNSSK